MALELNQRTVFRRTGEFALLYDPDRKYTVSLNKTGIMIYELLRKFDDLETVLTEFAGDDRDKRGDVENFLRMLTNAGYLAGYDTPAEIKPAVAQSVLPDEHKYCIGNSMSGTFETGDRLEVCNCPPARLQRGDVISFLSRNGIYVGHRIVGGRTGRWITMGDNNDRFDRHPVTLEQKPRLITGRVHFGRYYPVAGGKAGMRHFYFVRFKRRCRRIGIAIVKTPVLLLQKCCFWRKTPDRQTDFGKLIQYSYRGKVIGWKINGRIVYARHILRFSYRLPSL